MKRKKYNNGTGNKGITDYMPSPSEVLAEDSINKAKAQADAADNPWAMAIQIAGALGGNYASSGKMADTDAMATGFGQFATKHFANGTGPNGIEAEGGEIIEPPGGMPVELAGPSHENGGIDLAVPAGTLIFSDRLKVDGKTMAERKEARDNRRRRIASLVDDNKVDIALRNTKERTTQILDAEEQQDLMIQQMADMYNGAKEYANGTGPGGTSTGGIDLAAIFANLFKGKEVPPTTEPDLGPGITPPIMSNSGNYATDQEALMTDWFSPGQTTLPGETPTPEQEEKDAGYRPGIGDAIGIGGDIISAFGPLINTLNSRATDTPNINAFEGFGEDALQANSQAKTYIQDQRDNANRKIRSNANTSKRAVRNSARSVNTQRALDLSVDAGVNDAQINVNDVFARQMMELFAQQAGLENQQDAAVMQGEQARDVADRQDKDAFYTNKGRDISTLGTGIQQIGKDVNNIKEQEMLMKALNQMSKYFKYDSKGNIIGINQTTTG